VFDIGGQRRTKNQNIVEEYNNIFSEERSECVVHGGLEGGRCIVEAKRHNLKFVMSVVGAEGCFVNIIFGHSNLVKAMRLSAIHPPTHQWWAWENGLPP